MNRPEAVPTKNPHRSNSIFRAARLEEFLRLNDQEHLPLVASARAVGLAPSTVSGKGSILDRYLRDGLVGLERHGSGAGAGDLSRRIEGLGWFVAAAQLFYLAAHRRRGALGKAVHRTAALPTLPLGWSRRTRASFLAHLGLDAVPQCPEGLRGELFAREQAGKPIVPPRIARLIKASPSRARRHCFEARVEDLAHVPFAAIAKTLAESEPGTTCRLTLELL